MLNKLILSLLMLGFSCLNLNAYEIRINKTTKPLLETTKPVDEETYYTRDDKKEVVIDSHRKLMWQDNEEVTDNADDWEDAKEYCEELEHANFTDWYLPTIKELERIARPDYAPRAIIKAFKYTKPSYFWSSSVRVSDGNYAWIVDFKYGNSLVYGKSNSSLVRCVRRGQ